ncbi:LacI family DNA-binding transcriptional regulator [Anaerolineales bacterium HSG25]|nr:LacI family DNA-binding transcriptional regulator [Anaerolineales bacterium HSG25]
MSNTIHDVAKQAGVGIGTVSSVLNNSRPVSQATREKVLAAIDKLDFVPNSSGRRLSMGRTNSIAVIIPYFTSSAQIERLRGVMSVIVESDYDINLFTVENAPQRDKVFQTVPRRGRVDGLLIFSLNMPDKDLKRIRQGEIPTVLVESSHPELPNIYVDDIAATRKAVEYLADLGHQNIAYVGDILEDPLGSSFNQNRYLGYCQGMENKSLPVHPPFYRAGWHRRAKGRQVGMELLEQTDRPTAVFAFCDELALGIIEAARELNINVPSDLSVIGYDDIELAHFAQLTTVRQHLFESGVQGMELLLNTIDTPNYNAGSIQLETKLIVRQTTVSPNQ